MAQFPIPVLAGIGHERDETIVDRVAYRSVKTPTAAAAFLIERFNEAEGRLEIAKESLMRGAKRLLQDEKTRQVVKITELKQFTRLFLEGQENRLILGSRRANHASELFLGNQMNYLERLKTQFGVKVAEILTANRYFLELAETKMKYADPKNILEKGFSITRVNGKAVRDSVLVRDGDILETELFKGVIRSEVKDIDK